MTEGIKITKLKPGDLNPDVTQPKHSAKESFHNAYRLGDADLLTHLLFQNQKQGEMKLGMTKLKGIVLEIPTRVGDEFLANTATAAGEKNNRWQVRVFIPELCNEPPGDFLKQPLSEADQKKMARHFVFTAAGPDMIQPKVGQHVWVQFPTGELDPRNGICLGVVEVESTIVAGVSQGISQIAEEKFNADTPKRMAGGFGETANAILKGAGKQKKGYSKNRPNPEPAQGWPSITDTQKAFSGVLLPGGYDDLDGGAHPSGPKKTAGGRKSEKGPYKRDRHQMEHATVFVIHDPGGKSSQNLKYWKAGALTMELNFLKAKFVRRNVQFWMSRSGVVMQAHKSLEWACGHASGWVNDHSFGMEIDQVAIGQGWKVVPTPKNKLTKKQAAKATVKLTADWINTLSGYGVIVLLGGKYEEQFKDKENVIHSPTGKVNTRAKSRTMVMLPSLKQCEATWDLINALNKVGGQKIKIPITFPGSITGSPGRYHWNRVGGGSRVYKDLRENMGSKLKQDVEQYTVDFKKNARKVLLSIPKDKRKQKYNKNLLKGVTNKKLLSMAKTEKYYAKTQKNTVILGKLTKVLKGVTAWQLASPHKSMAPYAAWWRTKIAKKMAKDMGKDPTKVFRTATLAGSKNTGGYAKDDLVHGISAHHRWGTHGDGGPIEYYCASRAANLSPKNAFYAMVYALCSVDRSTSTPLPSLEMAKQGAALTTAAGTPLNKLDLDGFTLSTEELNTLKQKYVEHLIKNMKVPQKLAHAEVYSSTATASVKDSAPEAVSEVVGVPLEETTVVQPT